MTNHTTDEIAGFRARVYQGYVHARHEALAPETIAGLEPRAAHLRQLIRRQCPEDKSAAILDVGCGHGALLYFAQSAGYRNIRGVDASPEQVAQAQQLGIEGIRQGDLFEALRSAAAESLDAVIAFDVIEHFTRDELVSFIDEVRRVLKKGGRWIMHTPNGDSPFCSSMRYHDFTHEIAYTRASISQILYSSGFREVRCYEDAPVPHGIKSLGRLVLWKCIRGVLRAYLMVETGAAPANSVFTQNFYVVATK